MDITRRDMLMLGGAAIAAATYEGKAAGDHAEFEARLVVDHAGNDGSESGRVVRHDHPDVFNRGHQRLLVSTLEIEIARSPAFPAVRSLLNPGASRASLPYAASYPWSGQSSRLTNR